jgi:hypothetical protein
MVVLTGIPLMSVQFVLRAMPSDARGLPRKTASFDFLGLVLKCGRRLAGKHLKHQADERQLCRFWMGGRVVEGTSLENWRTFARTVGSNPTPSAAFC